MEMFTSSIHSYCSAPRRGRSLDLAPLGSVEGAQLSPAGIWDVFRFVFHVIAARCDLPCVFRAPGIM